MDMRPFSVNRTDLQLGSYASEALAPALPSDLAGSETPSLSPIPCFPDHTDGITALQGQIQIAIQHRQYPQARRLLSRLMDLEPLAAEHVNNRALVDFWQGQYERAMADCNLALALDDHLDAAYNNRGNCHAALGHSTAALADYQRAIDLNPFNVKARLNLGLTLRQQTCFDKALTVFDDALLFYQFPERIWAERGRTYHLRGDWNCAVADYRRTLEAIQQQPGPARQSSSALEQRVQGWLTELLGPHSRS